MNGIREGFFAADRRRSIREEVGEGARGAGLVPLFEPRACSAQLVSSRRDAPLSPDAFATVLSKKEFTNGADSGTVINLYRNTATALLGSTRELRYDELEWSEAQFERLGEALCHCGALETLEVRMELATRRRRLWWRAPRRADLRCRRCHLEWQRSTYGGSRSPDCRRRPLQTLTLYALRIPQGVHRLGAHQTQGQRRRSTSVTRAARPHARTPRGLGAHVAAELHLTDCDPSRRCPTCRRSRRCRRSTSGCAPHGVARPLGAHTSLQNAQPRLACESHGAALTCRRSHRG